ncbi:MAG: hypothetical protein M2R45_01450 [Verrucomicrobia subdivision 3 bacterium]|nr:hypothetical protein [Limisphaerales bacterium]MCS1417605.1 hypothetical protein [Limisphaerales bacterium]
MRQFKSPEAKAYALLMVRRATIVAQQYPVVLTRQLRPSPSNRKSSLAPPTKTPEPRDSKPLLTPTAKLYSTSTFPERIFNE